MSAKENKSVIGNWQLAIALVVCVFGVSSCRRDMPTFQGQISEDQLVQLLAYIKSLQANSPQQTAPASSPAAATKPSPAPAAK